MANKDDYLTYYREFFENFAQTVNPNDQLPVKLGSYKLINKEVIGGVIDWTTQYLTQKKCPQNLIAPLIQIVIDETRKSCKKQPTACGFNPSDNAYEPLKLMQTVMAKTNEVCLRYLDNSVLCSLPPPGPPYNIVSVCASKNKRRRMEDRHVVVHDLNTMFNIQEASPSSYYAIFDGHAGHDAAAYSAAHLHQFLAENKYFVSNPEQALRDAFCKTDSLFIDKCNVERFNSGTTAVCALLRPKEKILYIAWVGDSQALLVNQGRVLQCVDPHKPSRRDEKERIETAGGFVCYWGAWRVNGQLAVSRAIGDAEYKPYVIAVPEIRKIPLDGGEDFLILACDGLWDFLSEDDAARTVYNMVCQCPEKTDLISEHLAYLSKESGSSDNISVIVVFLRDPSKIAADAHWANRNTMDTSLDNANNPFANSNGADNTILQKADGLLLNLSENFKHSNGQDLSPSGDFYHNNEKSNGKRLASEFDDEDDLGPETDVDAVDDVLSPSIAAAKALADGIVNNNPDGSFNPFVEKQEVEKVALEMDLDLQKQQSSEFDGQRSPREETPTPPADTVHDGGLEDNLGDSGEESEDEWNYIKGEEANKENIKSSQPDDEVANILEDADNMSQLNPNAAEFVPVSPTRSIPSPACRALLNDQVIAQSPKRPSEIDISVPNPQDFETEVKSRPSDFDSISNGHDLEGDQKTSDLMDNLLNGKSIDEIPEFQPGNTPTKAATSDEFHFGPNAAPFTPAKLLDQSESLSTKAVFGDESTVILDLEVSKDNVDFIVKDKEDDPMSMSFYKDQDTDSDPFDLNKVQTLPDNLDDFLAKPEPQEDKENIPRDDTISAIPEYDPSKPFSDGNGYILFDNDKVITTDLDKLVDDEKELASSVSNEEDEEESGICELAKSPQPPTDDFEREIDVRLVCSLPREAVFPLLEDTSNVDVCCFKPSRFDSPEPQVISPEPEPQIISPEPEKEKEPVFESEPALATFIETEVELVISPEPSKPEPEPIFSLRPDPVPITRTAASPISIIPTAASPEPELFSTIPQLEPVAIMVEPGLIEPNISSLLNFEEEISPEPDSTIPSEPEPITTISIEPQSSPILSPEPELLACELSKSPLVEVAPVEFVEDVCQLAKSPVPEVSIESPVEDVTSSVKDIASPIPDLIPSEQSVELSFAQEINTAVQDTVTVEQSSPIKEADQMEVCPRSTPKSQSTDAESVATADVNSFLDRSQISDLASPLSPGDQPLYRDGVLDLNHPLMKCVYPLPTEEKILEETKTEIKTEIIAPEFAEPVLLSPSKEKSKVTSSAPLAKEPEVAAKPKPKATTTKARTTPTAAAKKTPTLAAKTTSTPKTPTSTKTRTSTGGSATRTSLGAKPKPTTAALPKPKPAAEKKPLTNGDVKEVKKTTSTLTSTRVGVAKTSPSKPPARPTTAPARTSTTTAKPKPTTTTAASTTLKSSATTTRTSTTATTKTNATTRPTTLSKTTTTRLSATKPSTLTKSTPSSPPKPRPATAPAKPRVPLTKTVTKSVEAEKQNKDSANKLTASRTSTTTTRTSTARGTSATTTVKKTEAKATGTRTTLTKTTTTTSRPIGKKPTQITRAGTKTTTTKIEKPIQNGVSTVITEQITIVNDSELVKDNSPIDNKLVVESTTAD